ncbi:MAG: hypothetical protein ACREOF_03500 [Gemmatimonadales bacterium]
MTLADLVARWRDEAAPFQTRGARAATEAAESYATELEAWSREHELEAITLEQAAAESGYTYSALEKMVRRKELPNVGRKGAPRVRRGDLPRKPCRREPERDHGIAALTLAGRQRA